MIDMQNAEQTRKKEAEDKLRAQKKQQLMQGGADVGRQLEQISQRRKIEALTKAEEATNERKALEAKIRAEEEADRQKMLDKKRKLKEIVSEDKETKKFYKQTMESLDKTYTPQKDMMSKLFEHKTH